MFFIGDIATSLEEIIFGNFFCIKGENFMENTLGKLDQISLPVNYPIFSEIISENRESIKWFRKRY